MAGPQAAQIALVCVGTELLRGQVNTHQSWLSRKLQNAGLFAGRECTLPDDRRLIASQLRAWMKDCDALVVCGGLGPTFDDITREAAADALGRRMRYRQDLFDGIRRKLGRLRMPVPEENKRQAWVIDGAEVLENHAGSAPGQILRWRRRGRPRLMALLPGPYAEMAPMFERDVLPRLVASLGRGRRAAHWVVHLSGIAESAADERLAKVTAMAGPDLDFTILSSAGQVDYHVTAAGRDPRRVAARLSLARSRALQAVGDFAFGEGEETLESACGRALRAAGLTLAVAESCTGGLVGQKLTAVPGSSDYFQGGVIAYSNALKRRLLGVRAATLVRHGAVSAETAQEMARGARKAGRASVGLAVTGVAGPGGGSAQKPVGLVYVAVSVGAKTVSRELRLGGSRELVRARAAARALHLLLLALRGVKGRANRRHLL